MKEWKWKIFEKLFLQCVCAFHQNLSVVARKLKCVCELHMSSVSCRYDRSWWKEREKWMWTWRNACASIPWATWGRFRCSFRLFASRHFQFLRNCFVLVWRELGNFDCSRNAREASRNWHCKSHSLLYLMRVFPLSQSFSGGRRNFQLMFAPPIFNN